MTTDGVVTKFNLVLQQHLNDSYNLGLQHVGGPLKTPPKMYVPGPMRNFQMFFAGHGLSFPGFCHIGGQEPKIPRFSPLDAENTLKFTQKFKWSWNQLFNVLYIPSNHIILQHSLYHLHKWARISSFATVNCTLSDVSSCLECMLSICEHWDMKICRFIGKAQILWLCF